MRSRQGALGMALLQKALRHAWRALRGLASLVCTLMSAGVELLSCICISNVPKRQANRIHILI